VATEKRAYELHANVNSVEIGGQLRLEAGDRYETSDSWEINELEAHPKVKAAEKTSKKDGS